ncbi:MAG: RHS repeat-associated core domain-containing protein [Bacteroidales bacterium]|nr:RHS repeat-associated core domain-containing protein [Bacteroidales bacterium]
MQTYHTNITQYCFLPGGAIYKTTNGTGELLFTYTDHLGSITHITDNEGNLLAEQSFDAWGRARNPETWEYETIINNQYSIVNSRGYTGHEMLQEFGLINMNGRLYDPVLGRMLSPDNYIQMPDYTQNFNRYSYVLNNPLKYTDPSGDLYQQIIGGVMGGYQGYRIAQAQGYDFGDWQTYAYIGAGAVIGAFAGHMAFSIAKIGGFMANTVSIAAGTYINSAGMAALSGGRTDVTVGFGVGSYNFTQNEWNGIWTFSDNTVMENIGYFYGTFANFSDIYAVGNSINTTMSTNYEGVGHNSLSGGEPIAYDIETKDPSLYETDISIGPGELGNIDMTQKVSYFNI